MCTHFLTTGQNKEVDIVKKDLHEAQVIASQAVSPATKATLRTAVCVSCTWSPILSQALHLFCVFSFIIMVAEITFVSSSKMTGFVSLGVNTR